MKMLLSKNIKNVSLAVCVLMFIAIIPNVTSAYTMTVMNVALIYFITALGLTLMQGMGGLMSMAQVSFMGIGGFTTAQLAKNFGLPSVLSVVIAIGATAVVAFALGSILLRLQGSYFVFSTIGFSQIMLNIFLSFRPFSGGPDGISNIPKLNLGPLTPGSLYQWFYLLMIVAVICGLVIENIRRTNLGRSLASVRDNEIAAMSLGVNVYMTKLISFTIAGALAGLAGALFAHHNSFISYSLFTTETATLFLLMVMLGGVNSTVGTFVGAILVTMMPEWMRPLKQFLMLFYGVGVILMMVFMPMGLAGLFSSLTARFSGIYRRPRKRGGAAQ